VKSNWFCFTDSGNYGLGGGVQFKNDCCHSFSRSYEVVNSHVISGFSCMEDKTGCPKRSVRITTIRCIISHKNINLVNSCMKRICCPLSVTFHKRRHCPLCAITVIKFLLQQFKLSFSTTILRTDKTSDDLSYKRRAHFTP